MTERISYNLSRAIPSGRDLVETAVEIKNQAFRKQYLNLGEHNLGRLSTPDRIIFMPKEEILSMEEEDRDLTGIKVHQLLSKAGVPAQVLRSNWCWSVEERACYWTPLQEKPLVYLDELMFERYEAKDEGKRRGQLLNISMFLASIDFYNLAFSNTGKTLDKSPWAAEMQRDFESNTVSFLQGVLGNRLNQGRLEEAKEYMGDLTHGNNVRFLPVGSLVLCVPAGRTELSPEHMIGVDFWMGTVGYLVEKVKRGIVDIAKARILLSTRYSYNETLDLVFGREDRQKNQRSYEATKRLFGLMGLLTEEAVMDSYPEGLIPDLYYEKVILPKIKPELGNPFDYGQFPISGEVALESYLMRVLGSR